MLDHRNPFSRFDLVGMGNEMTTGRRFFIVDEEHLRDWVLEHSPELQRDTERMADLIRELLCHERAKAGLDDPHGTAELWLNKNKHDSTDPDWIGKAKVMGRAYRVSAWFKNFGIKLVLLPPKRT